MTLPSAFLPNTYYMSLICRGVVDGIYIGEQYVKQTYRNRADFLTANGVVSFSVPVRKMGFPCPSIAEVLISEHGGWRSKLWQMLKSSYTSTPYWSYYSDDIRQLIFEPIPRLIDYNQAWLMLLCRLMDLDCPRQTTEQGDFWQQIIDDQYIKRLPRPKRYWQVFEQKMGFQPYISSLDLLLNVGPESKLILFGDGQHA